MERMLKEMVAVIEEFEDEFGELASCCGDLVRSFLAKRLGEKIGRDVKDSEIILALFFLVIRRNFEEAEEAMREELSGIFEIFRKVDERKW